MVNSFTYGLTRLDENLSGVSGTGFQFEPTALSPLENWSARARGRTNPLQQLGRRCELDQGKTYDYDGIELPLQPEQHVDVYQCFPAVCLRRHRIDRARRGHRYLGAKLFGRQARQSEPATGQSDRGDERLSHAVGHIERRFCHLSIQQERTSAAAGDAAAALVHRTYLCGLYWRRLSREP